MPENFLHHLTFFAILTTMPMIVNLWGFERVTSSGPEKGAYYHGHFLKGKYAMVKLLTRQRGNKTADSSVHSSPKPTKPKLQKAKRNTVTKQSKDQMFTKSFDFEAKTCRQHTDGTTSCVRNENQVSMAGEHSVASQQNYEQAIDSQASAILAERKLFFEGCEFFPLEEERYDELEELILQAGTDILNWPRTQQDPEQSISGSRALSFGLLPPPSQLCRV